MGFREDTCLYYPNFSFEDEAWAKQALIVWDKIATIVPADVDTNLIGNETYRLLKRANLVENWPVELWVRETAAQRSLKMLDAGQQKLFSSAEPFRLNFGKLTEDFFHELNMRGFTATREGTDVVVEGDVGMLIMSVLAHTLSSQTHSAAMTDKEELADSYLRIAHREPLSAELDVIRVDLSIAVPDLSQISVGRWIEFRKKHRAELEMYRGSIRALSFALAAVDDAEKRAEVLEKRRIDVQAHLDRNDSPFKRLGPIAANWGPSLVIAGGAFAMNPLLDGLLAAASGFGPAAISEAVRRKFKRAHGMSFLLEIASAPRK